MSDWKHNESYCDHGMRNGHMSYSGDVGRDDWDISLEFHREPSNPDIGIGEDWDDYESQHITLSLSELREIVRVAEEATKEFGEMKVQDSIDDEERWEAQREAHIKEREEKRAQLVILLAKNQKDMAISTAKKRKAYRGSAK